MLDSQARKNSESFDKIKKFIVLKIQEAFDDSLDVVESLESKRKKEVHQAQDGEIPDRGRGGKEV